MTRTWSSIATSSSAASDAFPSNIARWWSCTTTSTCRSTRSPRPSASPSGRSDPVYIMRCVGCARHSMPTRGRPRGRRLDEYRSRHHTHRSVVAGGGRHRAPGPRPGRRSRPSPRDPTASAWWPARRFSEMNNAWKLAIAAAAVVVVAVAGINLLPRKRRHLGPGPSPTPNPDADPVADAGAVTQDGVEPQLHRVLRRREHLRPRRPAQRRSRADDIHDPGHRLVLRVRTEVHLQERRGWLGQRWHVCHAATRWTCLHRWLSLERDGPCSTRRTDGR